MTETISALMARHRQFLVYVAGGLASAAIDVGLMQLLISAGVNYLVAVTASFGAALMFNFMFHTTLTFAAPPSGPRLGRYLGVVALNYGLTLGCVSLAVTLGAPALAGKLVSLPLVAIIGFLLGKYWIFK